LLLLVLAITGVWYFSSLPGPGSEGNFQATVNRDCAPWDGAAFTVQVQFDSATVIYISIWQSPDILLPSTFKFQDETGRVGNAYILPELGPYTLLNGEVHLQRVQEGMPLEGRFRLTSAGGGKYEGRFTAEWLDQIVYCG
jgi:hypothetical protein